MAAFRFKLQPVLDLREQKEKEEAVGLARARIEADAARQARADLEAVREAGRARLAEAHGAGGPVGYLQNLALVVDSVDARIADAEEACRQADERVAQSRNAFQEALQQRMSIDQLRTRRLEEWRTEQSKTEQKTMDEVALTRHGRQRSPKTDEAR